MLNPALEDGGDDDAVIDDDSSMYYFLGKMFATIVFSFIQGIFLGLGLWVILSLAT